MTPSSRGFKALVGFVVAEQHALIAQVIAERIDDFVVEEFQQLVAGVDQIHLHAQVAQHRRVFAADDAGTVDGDRLRRVVEIENRVAVEQAWMVEIDVRQDGKAACRWR